MKDEGEGAHSSLGLTPMALSISLPVPFSKMKWERLMEAPPQPRALSSFWEGSERRG
jgi:hypothetical protein